MADIHDKLDAIAEEFARKVDLAKVVPLLTSALKEAIARIETLEAKVKALEEA